MGETQASSRPPFVYWVCLWGIGLAAGVSGIAIDIAHEDAYLKLGRDFSNLWMAGRLVLSGQTGCVFDFHCFREALVAKAGLISVQNYSYPPHALFIALPFGPLPYGAALALWTLAGGLFFTWAAHPWLPAEMPPYLAVMTPAAGINVWNGHYGFLLGGLWLIYFANIERRPMRAASAAALLTFKPHLGLLVFIRSLSRPRALVVGALFSGILIGLSVAAFGFAAWQAFFTATLRAQVDVLGHTERLYGLMMPSAVVVTGGGAIGLAAQCAAAVSAIPILVRFRRLDAFSAASATFLIVPYAFNYDMTAACLGYAVLLFRAGLRLGSPVGSR